MGCSQQYSHETGEMGQLKRTAAQEEYKKKKA
jgi:hypothetical protein